MKKIIYLLITIISLNIFTITVYANTSIEPVYDIHYNEYKKEQVWVTANSGLNIRTSPNLESKRIRIVPYGTKLIRLKHNIVPGWDLILYKENKYYVYNKYITTNKIHSYNMGEYRITFYCGCYKCNGKWTGQPTASGVYAEEGVTIATGKEFSFGTKIMIQGHIYTVQDRGVPNGCIDIYLNSHSECNKRGLYYTDIYLMVKDKGQN